MAAKALKTRFIDNRKQLGAPLLSGMKYAALVCK